MGKYIKTFNAHSEYAAFTGTTGFVKPNVSVCKQENEVHYNPIEMIETRLIITYLVDDASQPTLLYGYYAEEGQEEYWALGVNMFEKVEIDGVEVSVADLDVASGKYQLNVGEHTVAYTLKNPTLIGYDPNDPEGKTFGALFGVCERITDVMIPNSVTIIGGSAFYQCTSLTSVTIGTGVTSIGNYAFYQCSSLTSIAIPDSVTSIGEGAFTFCTNLTSITIPDSVTSIGQGAFNSCSSLPSINIPISVNSISYAAFSNCSNLISVTIPNSVTTIGATAFANCTSLTSVTVNATTPPTLGSGAFSNADNCQIYVPSASVDAYKAATNWSTYASRIQAIQ